MSFLDLRDHSEYGSPARPIEIVFRSSLHSELPVEVLTRTELVRRAGARELRSVQRARFHQLVLCHRGNGVHRVDFESVEMRPGTLLHIHPGQLQEFQFDPDFEALMVVYRADLYRTLIPGRQWFPGSDLPTRWCLSKPGLDMAMQRINELQDEQVRFDGSPAYVALIESLLTAFLARLELLAGSPTLVDRLPDAYVDLRRYLEEHVRSRPTVTACASDLGYSTRTLDRACDAAVGQTAKEVADERVSLEIRRLLTDPHIPIAGVGALFGFRDASSFSKFVQRHLGSAPTKVRQNSARFRD